MKKILISTVVSLLGFSLGLIGTYKAIPLFLEEDPIETHDTTALTDSTEEESTEAHGNKVIHPVSETGGKEKTESESPEADHAREGEPTEPGSKTTTAAHIDAKAEKHSPADARKAGATVGNMVPKDSLLAVKSELAVYKAKLAAVQKEMQALKAKPSSGSAATTKPASINGLSETLAKLEDKELKSILSALDESTFEKLYRDATSKNRVRLLQSLPSDKAASFIARASKVSASESAAGVPTKKTAGNQKGTH